MHKIEITHNEIPFYVFEHLLLINDDWILDNKCIGGDIRHFKTPVEFKELLSNKFYYNRGIYFMRDIKDGFFRINLFGEQLTDYYYVQQFLQISDLAKELRKNNHDLDYLHLLWHRAFSTRPLNSFRVFECLISKYLDVEYESTKLELTYCNSVTDMDDLELLICREVNGIKLDRVYSKQIQDSAFKHHYHLYIIGNIEEILKTLLVLTKNKNLVELKSTLFRFKIPDLEVTD